MEEVKKGAFGIVSTPADGTDAHDGVVAWIVYVNGERCVAFAKTRAKAKWKAVSSYWDAYGPGRWPVIRARRAMHYDASGLAKHGPRCWCEDYVQDMCDAALKKVVV